MKNGIKWLKNWNCNYQSYSPRLLYYNQAPLTQKYPHSPGASFSPTFANDGIKRAYLSVNVSRRVCKPAGAV